MDNIKQTSGEYFRSLIIVFYGLISGQVFFGLLSFFLVITNHLSSDGSDLSNIFIYIVPVFVLAGFILSHLIFKNRLKAISKKTSLFSKLADYRAALIIRYALLEGPGMFAIVVYLVTGNIIFILLATLIVLFFITIRPGREKVIKDLELNPNDEQILNNPNSEI
jgi:hypothetical protein